MKLEQLRYFVETARREHIGMAAKALAISPSAVSHSIASLEEELGRDLFSKNGKRISLTDHGKLLLEKAMTVLKNVSELESDLRSDRVELRGHYQIAAAHMICSRILTPAWSALQETHRNLTAEIYTLRSSDVASAVAAGKLDMGLCFNPQERPELQSKTLFTGKLVIAFRKGHKVWKKRSPFPSALLENAAVLPKAFQGIEICEDHPVFERFGIQPHTECLVDSYEVAVEKVACSDAWSLLPDWIAKDSRLKKLSAPMEWNAQYQICAVWPKDRRPSGALKKLLATLPEFLPKV